MTKAAELQALASYQADPKHSKSVLVGELDRNMARDLSPEELEVVSKAAERAVAYAPKFVEKVFQKAKQWQLQYRADAIYRNQAIYVSFSEFPEIEPLLLTPENVVYLEALSVEVVRLLKEDGFSLGTPFRSVGSYFPGNNPANPLHVDMYLQVKW